jgi:uncharacterized membrane protein YgcG
MRRHLILLGLLALAAVTLMAGCSADEIMSAGQTMGSLGSAGLGKAGEAVVNDTVKTVEAFVGKYESCLRLPERLFLMDAGVQKISYPFMIFEPEDESNENPGSASVDPSLFSGKTFVLKSTKNTDDFDGDPRLIALTKALVTDIQKAKATGLSDKPIRAVLDSRYEGYAYSGYEAYRKFGGILDSWKEMSELLENLDVLLDWVNIINMLAESPVIESTTAKVRSIIDATREFDMVIPVQTHDVFMIVDKVKDIVFNHYELGLRIALEKLDDALEEGGGQSGGGGQSSGGSQGGGSSSKFNINDLRYIYDGIVAYVGGRTYQTLGDKISICLIYDVLDAAKSILDTYRENNPDDFPEAEESKEDDEAYKRWYSHLDYKWVLTNCESDLDRVISDLTMITYIYDIRIDIPGLVSGVLR